MKKIFKNSSGNIIVESTNNGIGIVEMSKMNSEMSGEVIGYWQVRYKDNCSCPEFVSVYDRFIKTKYDFDIFKALKFGQKLAEILIETNEKNIK